MSRLKEILLRKEKREAELKSSLCSIISQLRSMGSLKIILFGSLCNGNVDVYSDLDLLVIMPFTRSGKEWMKMIYEKIEKGIASDIFVYNQREFDEKLPKSSFLQHIMNHGRVVYEKTV